MIPSVKSINLYHEGYQAGFFDKEPADHLAKLKNPQYYDGFFAGLADCAEDETTRKPVRQYLNPRELETLGAGNFR